MFEQHFISDQKKLLYKKFKKFHCKHHHQCNLCKYGAGWDHSVSPPMFRCNFDLVPDIQIDMNKVVGILDHEIDFEQESDKFILKQWMEYKERFVTKILAQNIPNLQKIALIKKFWVYKIHSNNVEPEDMALNFYKYDFELTPRQNVITAIEKWIEALAFDTYDDLNGTLGYVDGFLEKENLLEKESK